MNHFFQPRNRLWQHIQRYATTAVIFPATTPTSQPEATAVPSTQPTVQATLPEWEAAEPVVVQEYQAVAPAPVPVVTPTTPTPTPIPVSPLPPQPTRPPAPSKPAAPSVTPQPVTPSVQARLDDESKEGRATWEQLQSIVLSHRSRRAIEAEMAVPPTPTESPTPTPTVQREDTTQQPPPPLMADESVQKQPPAPEPPTAVAPEAEANSSQAVPLETAWPVQRITRETAVTPSPATPALTTPSMGDDEVQALRSTLDKVTPNQPTDSAIDFNPPRRPRPRETAVSPKTVQRQPGQTESEREMVPTEIGPLPADLWTLLDQEPPQSAQADKPQLTVSQSPPSGNPDVPPQEIATSQDVQPPLPVPAQPIVPSIQAQHEERGNTPPAAAVEMPDQPLPQHPSPEPATIEPMEPEAKIMEQPIMPVPDKTKEKMVQRIEQSQVVDDPLSPVESLYQGAQEQAGLVEASLPYPGLPEQVDNEAGSLYEGTQEQIGALDQEMPGQVVNQAGLLHEGVQEPVGPVVNEAGLLNEGAQEQAGSMYQGVSEQPGAVVHEAGSLYEEAQEPVGSAVNGVVSDGETAVAGSLNTLTPDQDETTNESQINEVARQVYRQLKRRLDVEWERVRSRR